jgi:hypothetical protein
MAKNIALLDSDPLAIASISQVAFVRDGTVITLNSTYPLRGTVSGNIRRFWQKPTDCSRLYRIRLADRVPHVAPWPLS